MPDLPVLGSRQTFTASVLRLTFKATQRATILSRVDSGSSVIVAWAEPGAMSSKCMGHCIEQRSSEPWRREEADALWTTSEGLVWPFERQIACPCLLPQALSPWRSLFMWAGGDLSQIVSKSLRQILEVAQIQPESLVAAIGPCIHSNAFIDADVAGPFETRFGHPVVRPTKEKTNVGMSISSSQSTRVNGWGSR